MDTGTSSAPTHRIVNQYRLCGERQTQGMWLEWQGVWVDGDGPSTPNEHHNAVKYVQQGQRNVRWEFRTVAYSEITTLEVTA